MPRRDGTGPVGQGPLTGRGRGVCAGVAAPNYGYGLGYGRGYGNPRGYGFGCRRGFGRYIGPQISEKEQLTLEKEWLESQLEWIEKALSQDTEA